MDDEEEEETAIVVLFRAAGTPIHGSATKIIENYLNLTRCGATMVSFQDTPDEDIEHDEKIEIRSGTFPLEIGAEINK